MTGGIRVSDSTAECSKKPEQGGCSLAQPDVVEGKAVAEELAGTEAAADADGVGTPRVVVFVGGVHGAETQGTREQK